MIRETGQPQQGPMRAQAFGDVVALQVIFAFGSREARSSDEPAKRRIRLPMLGQRNEREITFGRARAAVELGADDEPQRQLLRSRMCPHDSGHGALVGQCEPRIAELGCGPHELLWMRGPAQEREIAEAVQLGVNVVCGLHGMSAEQPVQEPTTSSVIAKDPQSLAATVLGRVVIASDVLFVPPPALDSLGTRDELESLLARLDRDGLLQQP